MNELKQTVLSEHSGSNGSVSAYRFYNTIQEAIDYFMDFFELALVFDPCADEVDACVSRLRSCLQDCANAGDYIGEVDDDSGTCRYFPLGGLASLFGTGAHFAQRTCVSDG